MNINVTIIVQAINLFITFWVVRFLLIKPVMAALTADQEIINALNNTIENAKQHITQTTVQREHVWHDARDIFKHEQPQAHTVSDVVFKDIAPSLEVVTFSEQDKNSFIDQSTQKIIARLEHGLK